jgi:2-iminoacetate synthase
MVEKSKNLDFADALSRVTESDVKKALSKDKISEQDLIALLSPAASGMLEEIARKAHETTIRQFGRVIQLFIPLYLSNYCSNECVYCGFNRKNSIRRSTLTMEEIEREGEAIARTGMKHILILTGEAPALTPVSWLAEAVGILKKHFASISIEIFPMETAEYRQLAQAGVDGITVFQEVYDREIYAGVHPGGRKADYAWRLGTPERAAEAGLRTVGIGPLFGLGEPMHEAFLTALHAAYLQDRYPGTEVSMSSPRINPSEGSFQAVLPLSDKGFVQILLAWRLFLPRAGITLSTRERPSFRDQLIPLGVTRMSAGSLTTVGGYEARDESKTPQFEISDDRGVSEIAAVIAANGYEPVYKDWEAL